MGCEDGGCAVYVCVCVCVYSHEAICVLYACASLCVEVLARAGSGGLQQSNVRVMSLMSDPRHSQCRGPHLKAECLSATLMR